MCVYEEKTMEDDKPSISEIQLKVVVAGYIGIGKTQLLNRLAGKEFNRHYNSTVALHLERCVRTHERVNYTFFFWELDDRDHNVGCRRLYTAEADMVILMWDASTTERRFREPSFKAVGQWLNKLDDIDFALENRPVLFVMNKTDRSEIKEPTPEEKKQIEAWVKTYGIKTYDIVSGSVKDSMEPFEQKLVECAKKTTKAFGLARTQATQLATVGNFPGVREANNNSGTVLERKVTMGNF